MAEVQLKLGIKFLDKDIEVSAITKQVQKAINAAIAKTNLKELKKKFAELQKGLGKPSDTAGIKKETAAYETQTKKIRTTSKEIERLARAKQQAATFRVFGTKEVQILNSAQLNMRELQQTFEKGGTSAAQFGMRIGEIAKRFSGFFIWTAALFKLMDAIRATTTALKELDDTAISIEKVVRNKLTKPMSELQDELIGVAEATNRNFGEVADAMTGFVRTGISVEESLQASRAAMDLLNTSTVDATTAQKLLTTTVNAMGVSWEEAGEKVAVFSDLADRNAVVVKDLAQGFIRAGASAAALGISTEELAAMLATVTGVTQIAANRVGTALRTMLIKFGQNREEIIKFIAAARNMDATMSVLNSKYNSTKKVLGLVSQEWNNLTEAQRVQLTVLTGTGRRFTELSALMGNSQKFQDNLTAATEKSNSVQEKSEIQARSLEAAHNQLNNAITRFAKLLQDIGATDVYKNIIRGVSTLVGGFVDVIKFAEGISDRLGSISPLLGGITSAFGAIKNIVIVLFAQVLIPKIKQAYQGFTTFITGSKAGLEKLLGIEGTRGAAANATTQAYNAQNATLQAQIGLLEKANALQTGRAAGAAATTGIGGVGAPRTTQVGGVTAAARKLDLAHKQFSSSVNKVTMTLGAYNKQTVAGIAASAAAAKGTTAFTVSMTSSGKNIILSNSQVAASSKTVDARFRELAVAAKRAAINFGKRVQKGIVGIPTGVVKGAGGALKGLTSNIGVQTVAMIGAMQVLDGFSAQLDTTAEDLKKSGNVTGAALATAGSNISSNLALAAPFGPAAWAAAVALGGLESVVDSVSEAIKARADLAEQEEQATTNILDSYDLVALAQKEYAVAQGLVNKGLAKWVKTMDLSGRELTRRLEIDLGKIPVRISAEVLRTAGLEQTKKDMNDLILQAEELRTKWEQTKFEINSSQAALKAFSNLQKNIAQEKLKMDIEFESKNFSKVSKEVDNFRNTLLDIQTSQITVEGETVSDSLNKINHLLDVTNIKFVRIDEQIGSWKESMDVTSPMLEDMRGRLDSMNAEARMAREEFDLMAAALAATTTQGKVKLVDIKGVQSIRDALEDAKNAAAATGDALSDKEVKDIAEQFQRIAQLTGGDIPKNSRESVTIFTKMVKRVGKTASMMDYLKASGAKVNKEVIKFIKAGEKQLKFTTEIAEATKAVKDEEAKVAQQAIQLRLNLAQALKIADARVAKDREQIKLNKEKAQTALKEQIILQNTALASALYATNTSATAKAAREVYVQLSKNRDKANELIVAAKASRAERIAEAEAIGLTEEQIQPILRQIDTTLELELSKLSEDSVKTMGKRVQAEINQITELEKARFNIVRAEIERTIELEEARAEVSKSVVQSMLGALQGAGLTDVEVGQVVNTDFVKEQLAGVNDTIQSQLSNAARIELAYTIRSINTRAQGLEATLKVEEERARKSGEIAKAEILASKISQAENKRKTNVTIATSKAMAQSVEDSFSRMDDAVQKATAALDNMVSIRKEIVDFDKKISKLKKQIEFGEGPKELTDIAGQKKVLEARNQEIKAQIQQVKAWSAHNKAIVDQQKALQNAKDAARDHVLAVKRDLGLTMELTNAFGQVAIASETAANKLFTTEDAILRVRTESADAALQIYKSEFDKLKGFGQTLYTASPAQIAKLAQANALLQNSTRSISETLATVPTHLKDAVSQLITLKFGEKGEELIAKAGLERLGIPADKLDVLRDKIVSAANVVAQQQVQQLEEQQRTADNSEFMTSLMERQVRQNEHGIKLAEEAQKKIDELKEEQFGEEGKQTLKQQLSEAKEQRKLLRGQLDYQKQTYQRQVDVLNSIDPGMKSLIETQPQHTAHLSKIVELTGQGNARFEAVASSIKAFSDKMSGLALGATADLPVVDLQDAQLAQTIIENTAVITPLTARMFELSTNVGTLQQIMADVTESYKASIGKIDEIINTMAEEGGIAEEVNIESMTTAVQNANKAVMSEVMVPKQDEIIEQTKAMAITAEESKGYLDMLRQNAEASKSVLEQLNTTTMETRGSVDLMAGGSNLNAVKSAVDAVKAAVNAIDIKVNVTVKNIVNKYGSGPSAAAGLSEVQIGRLVGAARNEKSKMPVGSELVVANSSELIMTPKQAARVFGQINIPDSNSPGVGRSRIIERASRAPSDAQVAIEGLGDVPGLMKKLGALMEQQDDLMALAKDKKLFTNEQHIKLDVDGKREVTVKGLSELSKGVEKIVRKETGKLMSKAEGSLIKATINHILRRLKESGMDGV